MKNSQAAVRTKGKSSYDSEKKEKKNAVFSYFLFFNGNEKQSLATPHSGKVPQWYLPLTLAVKMIIRMAVGVSYRAEAWESEKEK